MELKPLFSRIKVRPDEATVITKSGIILPDQKKNEKKITGTIVAIGDEVEFLDVGDRILYGEYAGFPRREKEDGTEALYESEGQLYQYMNEEDVVARFK